MNLNERNQGAARPSLYAPQPRVSTGDYAIGWLETGNQPATGLTCLALDLSVPTATLAGAGASRGGV